MPPPPPHPLSVKSNLKVASEVPSKFTIIHDLLHQQQQQQSQPQPAATPASKLDPPRKYSNFNHSHQKPSSTSKSEPLVPNLLLLATLIPNSTNIRTSMENEPAVEVPTTATRLLPSSSTAQSKI